MVSEILGILLSNAVKFSACAERPRISIVPCDLDGRPGVEVSDNGVGFEPRYAGKLFGVFERLYESDGYTGDGMDLAIAKRLVERQGGSIIADSRGLGHGASFRFTIGSRSRSGVDAARRTCSPNALSAASCPQVIFTQGAITSARDGATVEVSRPSRISSPKAARTILEVSEKK